MNASVTKDFGTYNREEWVAPILNRRFISYLNFGRRAEKVHTPGRPCLTGLYEHENSAR